MMRRAVSYFVMIGLHPSYALVLLGAVAAAGAWTVWLNADDLDSGLGMLLFVQMFLASSGFAVRARQGHFDPLLTHTGQRSRIAAAHWIASAGPGIAAWFLLVAVGYAVGSGAASSAFAGTRLAALLIVSVVAWSAGFMLPRGAAGIVWIAILLALLITRAELIAASHPGWPWALAGLVDAMALTLCPFLLIGTHPALASGALPGAVVLSAALWVVALHLTRRLDVYLVDGA